MNFSFILIITIISLLKYISCGDYNIGTGIADITGQIAEIAFMGYAAPDQVGNGLHTRMFSRAYVIEEIATSKRFVYVSIDACMQFQLATTVVLENINKLYPGFYTNENVIISGTHTHSTPGGVGGTALVEISTKGFSQENFDATVNGIVESISKAHISMRSGSIRLNNGALTNANINRSPTAYANDPAEEQAFYGSNTEHSMALLRLDADDGTPLGMINFFSVHGTSMNNTNLLVSSDNKGYASLLFEAAMNPGSLPGQGAFVAAFGQTNEGDSSPNTAGPSCPDGSPCNDVHSTCGGYNEGCTGKGPGKDMFQSCEMIATYQFETAMNLYKNVSGSTLISGPIDYRHSYVNMQEVTVTPEFSSTGVEAKTCLAALGYAFAAGTTDGPGEFDFTQGTNSSNPFWNLIAGFLATPTPEQIACQKPKPILLDVSLIKPTEWVPYIVPLQIVRLGQLYIIAFPGEATTMSGRRLRDSVQAAITKAGGWTEDSQVVIAGLANSYSHYTATYEEYQMQRYEGGSTLYGPHQLNAYQQEYSAIATALVTGQPVPAGPTPEDMRGHTFSFILPVVDDTHPIDKDFGSIHADVNKSYIIGDIVQVEFWSASPRNDLMTGKTFLTVEQLQADGSWTVVAVDSNWETKFVWRRMGVSNSKVTITWDTSKAISGTYRIQHFGASKDLLQKISHFHGTSSEFYLSSP